MRQIRTVQSNIFDLFADHEIGRELHRMSRWLDQHFELSEQVAQNRGHGKVRDTGLPAESVLRCALLKQYLHTKNQISITFITLFRKNGILCSNNDKEPQQ